MVVSSYSQLYQHRHLYNSSNAITIPITLSSTENLHVDLPGKLDTGSTFCVFEKAYADLLGLEPDAGIHERVSTITGKFDVVGHAVTLSVFGYEWEAFAYFARDEIFVPNVLGRVGFLDHLRVGIVDYERLLYCGLYE